MGHGEAATRTPERGQRRREPEDRFTYIICMIHAPPLRPSRLDDLHHAGDGVLTKQSAGNGPKSAAVISRPRHSPRRPSWQPPSPSPCPHPERRRSSRPIQKCPVITGLSVVIFINKRARDDPAGMLMSPQLELISCRRRRTPPPGPPRSSCQPHSPVARSCDRSCPSTPPPPPPPHHQPRGFHKRKCFPSRKK